MHGGPIRTGVWANVEKKTWIGVSVLANAGVFELVARQQALISTLHWWPGL